MSNDDTIEPELKFLDCKGPTYEELECYPLQVRGDSGQEIMRIEINGDIYLRGALIGSDKEVAEQFERIGMGLKGMNLAVPLERDK